MAAPISVRFGSRMFARCPLDDIQLFPISWCYKRLYNGPEDSVVKKYLAFREVIDSRSQEAEPGAAADGGAFADSDG